MEDDEVEGDGPEENHVPREVPAGDEVGADVAEKDVHPALVGDVATGEEKVGEHGVEVAEQRPHERQGNRPAGPQPTALIASSATAEPTKKWVNQWKRASCPRYDR